MARKVRALTPASLLLRSLFSLGLGSFCLAAPTAALALTRQLLAWGLWIAGGLTLVHFFGRPGKGSAPQFIQALALWAGAAVCTFRPQALGSGVTWLFGLWMMLNALFKWIYALQLKLDKAPGFWRALLTGLVHGCFGAVLLADPLSRLVTLWKLLGAYFLVNSFFLANDFLRELLALDLKGKPLSSRVRLSPPILLTALMPLWLLQFINRDLDAQPQNREAWEQTLAPAAEWSDRQPVMEVFFHLSRATAFGFGHADICLKDRAYSYGCYNEDSHKVFGMISQGILVSAPRRAYIDYCIRQEKKKLVGFTLLLTQEQVERVEKTLRGLIALCEAWTPPPRFKNGGDGAYALWQATGCTFYRFTRSPFKTYNFAKTNCVALANVLCSATGLDLMNMNGIITPGTYCTFLNHQFERPNSIVVKRRIYK